MTLLQHLSAHKGGLIRLKNRLYWYYGTNRGWDSCEGRICLLLDVVTATDADLEAELGDIDRHILESWTVETAAALLLIDGAPHWIRVAEAGVERL